MILHPLENTAVFRNLSWMQKRPRITQVFGENQHIYKQFGMEGHNGIDHGVPVGTPVIAPFCGEVKIKKSGDGYGWHVRIRNKLRSMEVVLGHLSNIMIERGWVNMGDLVGFSGNTGFSTGPHLHTGVRRLKDGGNRDIWSWQVEEYGNGFYGYFDVLPYMVTFKGTHLSNSLFPRHS